MLLGGLWHGAALRFILWGAIHGISLATHKFSIGRFKSFKPEGAEIKPFRRIIGILFTFHIVNFSWIFFRADSMQTANEVITQILTNFHPEVIMQFIEGYRVVFFFLIIGFILHFMPKRVEDMIRNFVIRSPLSIQALLFLILIFIVVQVKSAGVQPFIYFQF
jgi:hypothetical protein